MNMQTPNVLAPPVPRSLEDAGLSIVMMRDILLKTMFRQNLDQVTDLAHVMCLPVNVTQELIDLAREQKLVEATGTLHANSGGEMGYQLTDAGKARARRAQPVGILRRDAHSDGRYNEQVKRQSIRNIQGTRDQLIGAMGHLILPDELLDHLGPAVSAGRSILMYGPPGNGKSSISNGVRDALGDNIFVPRAIEYSVPIRLSPTPTICRVWRRVAREADEAGMDVPQREDLSFPRSFPEFQRLFPDDAACAAYLEKARWGDGFVCPHCQTAAEPFRFTSRPGVLRCRKCRRDTGLTAGTVMERSHTSLGVWFWAAYLVASQTPGMSATQFQRQVGLSRYETAFQILHKLRAGMVRPDQDRIGSEACDHAEVDETWVGGRTRGKGRGVHHKLLVASAVEVRQRKPGTKLDKRKGGRYAGRVRLAVVPDRSAESLCGFVEGAVTSGASVITDDWSGYTSLAKRGYKHLAVAERGNSQVAEEYLPIIHLVFANLKTWLSGIHHGVSHQHLQAYLNEFTFRFNRRFCPFNAFRSLLGIAGDVTAPTYAELYSGDCEHPRCSGCG